MNKLTIELGGKQRTLKFNMLFLEEYMKKKQENETTYRNTALIIWAGLKANAEVTETPIDCTYEDCFDWAEEMIVNSDQEKMNAISEAMEKATWYKSGAELKKKMEMSQQTGTVYTDTPSEKLDLNRPTITI
jgi:hypothetical protein